VKEALTEEKAEKEGEAIDLFTMILKRSDTRHFDQIVGESVGGGGGGGGGGLCLGGCGG